MFKTFKKEINFMKTKILMASAIAMALIAGACSDNVEFNAKNSISVISREQGSGTRDAFTELTGVLVKTDGKKKDFTTQDALVIDGTQAVISNVSGNLYAIGYISLGSLNNTVKAVNVEGVAVNAQNVKDGSYKISRPFNVAFKDTKNEILNDFLTFIDSKQGAEIISKNGYIPLDEGNKQNYATKGLKGKLVIAGSSSVSPVMEKLKEAYMALNGNVTIEIQTNDSSSGMIAAKEGACDLGMASRNLKSSESSVLTSKTIAMDGIAVIVNVKNPAASLSIAQIKEIFTGNVNAWDKILK